MDLLIKLLEGFNMDLIWINQLQVGDYVILELPSIEKFYKAKVCKVTKTQVHIESASRCWVSFI